jgi:mannitol 2-dehydrogenase
LNRANLSSLPNEVKRPGYDVENVHTGIVHIGVGLRENDRAMKKVFDEQDNLYTLIEKYNDGACNA